MLKASNEFKTGLALALAEDGIKHKWLAERLAVTPMTVSRWAQGHNMPGSSKQIAISRLLGRSIEDLFYRQNIHYSMEAERKAA